MTLREGLAEYYRVNPGLSEPAKISDPSSAAYFHNHDSTHVIFGTHTGILHEGINDMWTMFGVDIRVRDYIMGFFVTDEGKAITKQIAKLPIFRLLWDTAKLTPKVWRQSRLMTKKWPWSAPVEYLDRPLNELRAEFGIQVLTS
jgi:hypothetical protein